MGLRGALAWDYSKDVAPMISIIAEGLHALGYDFFEYKNRHGMTVKQIMDKQFEIVDNISLLENTPSDNGLPKAQITKLGQN